MATADRLHDVTPANLHAWLRDEDAILLDVREPDEYAREHIPGARLQPMSSLAPGSLPQANGKKLVLQCNSGSRTLEAAARIMAHDPGELYQLAGGLQAWKAAGLPVEVDRRAPLPIMRQVQITAGALILLGLALALVLSPWFALLSAFVGAGLVFAGVTGYCGMARLLQHLPYNRRAVT